MMDTDRRYALAKINVALMLADARQALREVTAKGQPNILQAGVLLGITAAGHALDGMTADDSWAEVEPLFAQLRKDTTTTTESNNE